MHCLRENRAEPHDTVFLHVQPMFKKKCSPIQALCILCTLILLLITGLKDIKFCFYC